MNTLKKVIFAIGMLTLMAACQEDGPAEQMGETIDQAAKDAGNAIEDVCEDIKAGVKADDPNC